MKATSPLSIRGCPRFFAAGLLVLLASPLSGQDHNYRISQRGSISQRLGAARVALDYSRPLVRGRSDLFGKVVTWGEEWTPGANEATVLELSDTIRLNGHTVPAGRWSMWLIPSQVGPWELVLDPRDSLFHTQRPQPKADQVRFPVDHRLDAAPVEALTWTFPRVAHDGGTLQLNWGTMEIALEVQARSLMPDAKVAAGEAALYTGDWTVTHSPDPKTGKAPPPTVLTVRRDEHGMLIGRMPPPPAPTAEDGAAPAAAVDEAGLSPQEQERAAARRKFAAEAAGEFTYVLVPRAKGVFLMGWAEDGQLLEVYDYFHEFEFEDGRAVRLTLRDEKDNVVATATRERK